VLNPSEAQRLAKVVGIGRSRKDSATKINWQITMSEPVMDAPLCFEKEVNLLRRTEPLPAARACLI
jgi:hypothetical protein